MHVQSYRTTQQMSITPKQTVRQTRPVFTALISTFRDSYRKLRYETAHVRQRNYNYSAVAHSQTARPTPDT